MVILDNSTRWNSTYLSLHRALSLRKRIEHFCLDYHEELRKDVLTDNEWAQLEDIIDGLAPFYEVTLRLQGDGKYGHHGMIWEALPAIEALLEHLEAGRERFQRVHNPKHPLAVAYQNGWEKLRKYYWLTDDAHSIYAAAILLHPSHRKRYFDFHWVGKEVAEWKEVMIQTVKKTWVEDYKALPLSRANDDQQQAKQLPIRKPTMVDRYLQRAQINNNTSDDEFDSYIHGPQTVFLEPSAVIPWVLDPMNPWPGMRQQILDVLSIPAMSTELERVFSHGKLTITPMRNRLSEQTVAMLELLRHWWSNNIISQQRGGKPRPKRHRKPLTRPGDDANTTTARSQGPIRQSVPTTDAMTDATGSVVGQ
jgi:hypothetical protein